MAIISAIKKWWLSRRPKPLDQLLEVKFDSEGVSVEVIDRLELDWNQTFLWKDVTRICFRDGGLYSSDVIFVETRGNDKPAVILTEARGGGSFFGELTNRGLFPDEVWRRAIAETGGATYCWPPKENAS